MSNPKGKLVIIGGSVDRGSFSESEADLKRNLKFFEKGILKRITTESIKNNEDKLKKDEEKIIDLEIKEIEKQKKSYIKI